jgi:hypothetical protein
MPVHASARGQARTHRDKKEVSEPLTRRSAVPVPPDTPFAGYRELDDEVGVVRVLGDVSAEGGEVERREDLWIARAERRGREV